MLEPANPTDEIDTQFAKIDSKDLPQIFSFIVAKVKELSMAIDELKDANESKADTQTEFKTDTRTDTRTDAKIATTTDTKTADFSEITKQLENLSLIFQNSKPKSRLSQLIKWRCMTAILVCLTKPTVNLIFFNREKNK